MLISATGGQGACEPGQGGSQLSCRTNASMVDGRAPPLRTQRERAELRGVAAWVPKHWPLILFERVPPWVSRAQPGSLGSQGPCLIPSSTQQGLAFSRHPRDA